MKSVETDRLWPAISGRFCLYASAVELTALGPRRIDWVEGGHEALVAAGAGKVDADSRPFDRDAIDHLFFVHDRHDGNLDACRRYLAWETGLVDQLDAEERGMFILANTTVTVGAH